MENLCLDTKRDSTAATAWHDFPKNELQKSGVQTFDTQRKEISTSYSVPIKETSPLELPMKRSVSYAIDSRKVFSSPVISTASFRLKKHMIPSHSKLSLPNSLEQYPSLKAKSSNHAATTVVPIPIATAIPRTANDSLFSTLSFPLSSVPFSSIEERSRFCLGFGSLTLPGSSQRSSFLPSSSSSINGSLFDNNEKSHSKGSQEILNSLALSKNFHSFVESLQKPCYWSNELSSSPSSPLPSPSNSPLPVLPSLGISSSEQPQQQQQQQLRSSTSFPDHVNEKSNAISMCSSESNLNVCQSIGDLLKNISHDSTRSEGETTRKDPLTLLSGTLALASVVQEEQEIQMKEEQKRRQQKLCQHQDQYLPKSKRDQNETSLETKDFICHWDNCLQGFSTRTGLATHCSSHLDLKLPTNRLVEERSFKKAKTTFECKWNNCKEQFSCLKSLAKHLAGDSHIGQTPFLPKQQNVGIFSFDLDLRKSIELNSVLINSKDNDFLQVQSSLNSKLKRYLCSVPGCGKYFTDSSNRKKHEKTHDVNRERFYCNDPGCNKSYSTRTDLNIHLKVHRGEYPHRCTHPHCRKAFIRLSELYAHERTHDNILPHSCAYCGKSFREKSRLKKHEENHKRTPITRSSSVSVRFLDSSHPRKQTITPTTVTAA